MYISIYLNEQFKNKFVPFTKTWFFCGKCAINHLINVNTRDIIADCYKCLGEGDQKMTWLLGAQMKNHTLSSRSYTDMFIFRLSNNLLISLFLCAADSASERGRRCHSEA